MTAWRAIALAVAYIAGALALYYGYFFAWVSSVTPMPPDYYAELQLKAGALFWIGAGLLVFAIGRSIWLGWKRVRFLTSALDKDALPW